MSFPGSSDDMVKLFALTLKVSGVKAADFDDLEQRFLQALATGKVSDENARAFFEFNPYLMADILASFLNFTVAQVRAASRQAGGIPIEHITHALWLNRERIILDASLAPIGIRSQP